MKTKSDVTGMFYENEECVFYRNHIQAARYLEWGATIIDIFTDSKHKLVFVFSKADHEKYLQRWIDLKPTLFGTDK